MRELSPRDRPQRRSRQDLRKLLQGAGALGHPEKRRHPIFAGTRTGFEFRRAERRRAETSARQNRIAEHEARFHFRVFKTRRGKWFWSEGRRIVAHGSCLGWRRDSSRRRRSRKWRCPPQRTRNAQRTSDG